VNTGVYIPVRVNPAGAVNFSLVRVKGALQLQLTAMVKFALLRYLSEFRRGVSSF